MLASLKAGGSAFDQIAAWAAFVGVAAGLAGLLLYRGLREALTAAREANGTLRESLNDEIQARDREKAEHREQTETLTAEHRRDVEACHTKIADLTARIELLQSAWVTEIAMAVGQAVALGQRAAFIEHDQQHDQPPPRRSHQ